jgi:hypothetical protein
MKEMKNHKTLKLNIGKVFALRGSSPGRRLQLKEKNSIYEGEIDF